MRKRSLKTGADHGVCEKSGTTFRTGFRYSGLSGATIRTIRLPVFRIYFRGLLQKQIRKESPSWRLFLCAAKNGSAESLRLPLWSASINRFRCCIIYVNRRNMYRSHLLRRWGIRVPLSQALFSVAEVSKQGICPDKCRKTAFATLCFTPSFLL